MGLLRGSYSHQCPFFRPTMNNPWFLVLGPVLMGALGILSPKLRMGAIGTQRQGSLSEVMMGSIPTILWDYDWMPRVWKRCFFFMICLFLLTNMLGNTERKPRFHLGWMNLLKQKYLPNMKAKHWKSVTLHIVVILSSFLFLWNWILLHQLLSNITHDFITCPKQITAPFWGVKSFNLWHIRIIWSAMCDLITLDSLREESIHFTERE